MTRYSAPAISRFGALVAISFCFWTVIYRLLLPYGDEPDFLLRASELTGDEYPSWTPYLWVSGLLGPVSAAAGNCRVDAEPTSLWAHIDWNTCFEGIGPAMDRVILTLIIIAPILGAVVFRRFSFVFVRFFHRDLGQEFSTRLDAIALSLLIPGMIYYLGVLSPEQFTLTVSLLIVLFWQSWAIVLLLTAWIAAIDLGNSIIVFAFLATYAVCSKIQRKYSLRAVFFTLVLLCASAYVAGFRLLNYVQLVPALEGKALAMFEKVTLDGEFVEKYPILLRPFITFLSGVFMTPTGVKVIPVYVVLALAAAMAWWRVRQHLRKCNPSGSTRLQIAVLEDRIVACLCALAIVVIFVFLFPDYANAKYYMFLAPFLILPVLSVLPRGRVYALFSLCTGGVALGLLMFIVI